MGRILKTMSIGLAALWLATPFDAAALDDEACVSCHSDSGMVGEEFVIDPLTFDTTAHGELGCVACHESATYDHPDDGLPLSKAGCLDCHQEIYEEYALTGHADYADCGDCHNPHLVRGPTTISGHDMNRNCGVCHDHSDLARSHGKWLPQAALHLEMLPCISCHSGSENLVISLYISQRQLHPYSGDPARGLPFELAGYDQLKTLAADRDIASIIDTDGDGVISLAELREFNRNREFRNLRLKGMLTPEIVTHDFGILSNRWDCTFCHASGGAMQTSFIAFPRQDGSFERLPVEKGAILDALYGPDFYILGATRSPILNYMGLAILAAGLIMPVGHGTLRFLTRKNRQ
jgi:hypothetical protein